jgi:type IV pilus assembly protein PilB
VRERLVSRINVRARLDIAERRRPQDGRMRVMLDAVGAVDVRVSTLPTLFGEKVVLRLMRSDGGQLHVDALGLEPAQKAAVLEALERPDGMLLVTGPPGSGKNLTLYTLLARLNQAGVNISSAEEPAEMHLPGINQVNINERAGLGFATMLRALLRQDPDTLIVGEIRDLETADIAIKAAQTGHRVLSTLHARDAPGTLARLMSTGVAPFQLASAVRLITAQRLLRRLCLHCRRPDHAAQEHLRAQSICRQTRVRAAAGHSGRQRASFHCRRLRHSRWHRLQWAYRRASGDARLRGDERAHRRAGERARAGAASAPRRCDDPARGGTGQSSRWRDIACRSRIRVP